MDLKAIFLLVGFPTIYKKRFKDKFHNRFKPKNILKLSTNSTTIKSWVKYIKVRDNIELATYKDNLTAGKVKSITQLLWCLLFYRQIIIYFTLFIMQLELSIALVTYISRFLSHFIVYI